ncbi:SCO family protein, partial [Pseudomonas graminis]
MNELLTRRQAVTGMGLLGRGLLAGFDGSTTALEFKYGKDLSNKIMGRTFKWTDTDGEVKTLSRDRGLMQMVFFGCIQCP